MLGAGCSDRMTGQVKSRRVVDAGLDPLERELITVVVQRRHAEVSDEAVYFARPRPIQAIGGGPSNYRDENAKLARSREIN